MRVTELVAALAMLSMAVLTARLLREGERTPASRAEKRLDPHAASDPTVVP